MNKTASNNHVWQNSFSGIILAFCGLFYWLYFYEFIDRIKMLSLFWKLNNLFAIAKDWANFVHEFL